MEPNPLLIAILLSLAVVCFFVAMWRRFGAAGGVASRMAEYGQIGNTLLAEQAVQERVGLAERLGRLVRRLSFAEGLASSLRQADVPLTVTEFVLLTAAAAVGGLLLGASRVNLGVGLVLAVIGVWAPMFYLRIKAAQRRRLCADQLPDILMMLAGMLRSGYGLNQALSMVAEQAPVPSRGEYARVLQSVELGIPLPQALREMAARIQSDDVDLFVTAVVIQHELGGNLATTLDTIGDTIRERVRLQREIRAQTAQQQLSGYVLLALPITLALVISLISPDYMRPLFEPGPGRVMLVLMLVMQLMGYLIMRRILVLDV